MRTGKPPPPQYHVTPYTMSHCILAVYSSHTCCKEVSVNLLFPSSHSDKCSNPALWPLENQKSTAETPSVRDPASENVPTVFATQYSRQPKNNTTLKVPAQLKEGDSY